MAWDMQLSGMDVISPSPAQLCGGELSPCLLGSFIFPAEDPQFGEKSVCEDLVVQKFNSGLCLHMFIVTTQKRGAGATVKIQSFLTRELMLHLALSKHCLSTQKLLETKP